MNNRKIEIRKEKILLSPPHMQGREREYLVDAFDSNWIAPLGPYLSKFEKLFCEKTGFEHAVALTTGTAAIHLGLVLAGVTAGDEVLCSDFTFVASAAPIVQMGATPVFIDSSKDCWNMDPSALEKALVEKSKINKLPKAVLVVHLYGQSAQMDKINPICQKYSIPIISDSAEALGATYRGKACGADSLCAAFSFNGNKLITTSGGGMLASSNKEIVDKARFLSTQAKELFPYYQHKELGYNYRMSNLLAALGLGCLRRLNNFAVKSSRK